MRDIWGDDSLYDGRYGTNNVKFYGIKRHGECTGAWAFEGNSLEERDEYEHYENSFIPECRNCFYAHI